VLESASHLFVACQCLVELWGETAAYFFAPELAQPLRCSYGEAFLGLTAGRWVHCGACCALGCLGITEQDGVRRRPALHKGHCGVDQRARCVVVLLCL
jgi:hypothetical protein